MMRIIELLSAHIEEELEDAYSYAKLALEYKDTEPALAAVFYRLSDEEMSHMDMLHKQVAACISEYRQTHAEPPAAMQAIYDFVHKREIAKAERVASLQELYRK